METLDELEYYCNTPKPVGALMLTGEWGCGKTYLIKHQLKEALKETHVIVIVSLFGLSTIEEVRDAVKNSYWEAMLSLMGSGGKLLKGVQDSKDKFKDLTDWLPWGKKIADTVISINPRDFIKVENKIGAKDTILVFDDLERSKLDPVELLGVINDYCENRNFHTIIVTNEDRMPVKDADDLLRCSQLLFEGKLLDEVQNLSGTQKNLPVQIKTYVGLSRQQKEGLTYEEIKEKIVQRTIRYTPDYNIVIDSILNGSLSNNPNYNEFISNYKEEIRNLFRHGIPLNEIDFERMGLSEDQIRKIKTANNPHNLRSLKCAIQDFNRVYDVLKQKEVPDIDIEQWLYAFMMAEMSFRAGLISESPKYGITFVDVGIQKAYPVYFNTKFIWKFELDWICNGIWCKENAMSQIDFFLKQSMAHTPEEKVRTCNFNILDEDEINSGLPTVLQSAYDGTLELDEYIGLIENLAFARRCGLELSCGVEWNAIQEGITIRCNRMMESSEEDSKVGHYIDKDNWELYSEDELSTYKMISSFRSGDQLMFSRNRKLYVDEVKSKGTSAFMLLRDKRFDTFDNEMVLATADAFVNAQPYDRVVCVNDFASIWKVYLQSSDADINSMQNGFKTLKTMIEEEKGKIDVSKKIKLGHYSQFVEELNKLIDFCNKILDKRNRCKEPSEDKMEREGSKVD